MNSPFMKRSCTALRLCVFLMAGPAVLCAQQADSLKPRRPRPWVAIGEVTATNVVIQRFNWWVRHADWADITWKSWNDNIRLGWQWDVDQFQTNMIGHPWGGGFYFNAGRDNGLTFWGSAPLTFLGSAEWEYFGENEPPSLNDLYNTAYGGMVYGEIGHRLSGVVRDNRLRGFPRVAREIASLPFDPVGEANRIIRGEAFKVVEDGPARDHTPIAADFQVGARLAVDSGPARPSRYTGTFVADIAYGTPFAGRYREPFDVFSVRFQLSPDQGGINLARLLGRLYGHELTDSTAHARHIFTIAQKSEYQRGPAYKFGGQSLEAGIVSDWTATRSAHVQTEAYAEWLLLGGIQAPGAGVRPRDYDFGPGGGVNASATLQVSGTNVLSARWRYSYLHSVSGSTANHSVTSVSIEGLLPLGRSLGIGAYAGWYRQRSDYSGGNEAVLRYPEFRLYLAWLRGQWRHPSQSTGGSAL